MSSVISGIQKMSLFDQLLCDYPNIEIKINAKPHEDYSVSFTARYPNREPQSCRGKMELSNALIDAGQNIMKFMLAQERYKSWIRSQDGYAFDPQWDVYESIRNQVKSEINKPLLFNVTHLDNEEIEFLSSQLKGRYWSLNYHIKDNTKILSMKIHQHKGLLQQDDNRITSKSIYDIPDSDLFKFESNNYDSFNELMKEFWNKVQIEDNGCTFIPVFYPGDGCKLELVDGDWSINTSSLQLCRYLKFKASCIGVVIKTFELLGYKNGSMAITISSSKNYSEKLMLFLQWKGIRFTNSKIYQMGIGYLTFTDPSELKIVWEVICRYNVIDYKYEKMIGPLIANGTWNCA